MESAARTKAVARKEAGNKLYSAGDFANAIKCYKDASSLDPTDPVFPSNEAACDYELGEYEKALAASDRAIEILRRMEPLDAKLEALFHKCCVRKVKSLFHLGHDEAVLWAAMSLTSGDQEVEKILAVVNSARLPRDRPLTRFENFRPLRKINTREYYCVGHDIALSAMRGDLRETTSASRPFKMFTDTKGAMSLRSLPADRLGKMAFLFAGVGDGRHMLATLYDTHRQLKACKPSVHANLKMHIAINDFKAASLAKNLVMLCAIMDIATAEEKKIAAGGWTGTIGLAASGGRTPIQEDIEYAMAVGTAHYIFLGAVMPAFARTRLDAIVSGLLSGARADVLYSVVMDDNTKKDVFDILRLWANPPETHSVADILSMYTPRRGLGDYESLRATGQLSDEMYEQLTYGIQEREAELTRLLKSRSFNFGVPGSQPQKDPVMRHIIKRLAAAPASEMPGAYVESIVFDSVPIVLPPLGAPIEAEIWGLLGDLSLAQVVTPAFKNSPILKKLRNYVEKNWFENVTLFEHCEMMQELDFDPFGVTMNLVSIQWCEEPDRPTTIVDWTEAFFRGAGRELLRGTRARTLRLEMFRGDTHEVSPRLAATAEEREAQGLPSLFDRIFVSNIPDYTGLPAIFVHHLPLLRPVPDAFLHQSILLNTGVWADYDEYIHSYSLIPGADAAQRHLGLRLVGGDLWCYPMWSFAGNWPLPLDKLLARPALEQWLMRLFLHLALPSPRGARSPGVEQVASSIAVFVQFVDFLRDVGYPAHWLSHVLDSLLGDAVMTNVAVPTTSPNPVMTSFRDGKTAYRLNVAPFVPELRTVTSLLLPSLAVRPTLPVGNPGDVRMLRMSFTGETTDIQIGPQTMVYNSRVMGLAIGSSAALAGLLGGPVSMFMRMGLQQEPSVPVWDDLLSRHRSRAEGAGAKHDLFLFSAIHLDSKVETQASWFGRSECPHTVELPMSEAALMEFQKSGFSAVLLRTDNWVVVSRPVSMKNATVL